MCRVSKMDKCVTWVSWERGAGTAWQCAVTGLRAGCNCVRQIERDEACDYPKEHYLHDIILYDRTAPWKAADCQ